MAQTNNQCQKAELESRAKELDVAEKGYLDSVKDLEKARNEICDLCRILGFNKGGHERVQSDCLDLGGCELNISQLGIEVDSLTCMGQVA